MEAFWGKLKEKMNKKTEIEVGHLACDLWVGGREHNKYGRVQVTWPDGSKCVERAHRVVFMLEHKLLKDDMEKKTRSVTLVSQWIVCESSPSLPRKP